MFDYHMHAIVSFDGHDSGLDMALAAKKMGMKEICFTDHLDFIPGMDTAFDVARYRMEYDRLEVPGLLIRKGMEFGLSPDNTEMLRKELEKYPYDFVIGSVHTVDDVDVYMEPYWEGKTQQQAILLHLEQTLKCVQLHTDYDVLGHLTFLSKARGNPAHDLIAYRDYQELADEIMKELVCHGKGMELNTSGIDRCGGPLPTLDYFRRFKELGGEIVTVGSDAHRTDRVGQYTGEMAEKLKEIIGYVCTFQNRKPIFHR